MDSMFFPFLLIIFASVFQGSFGLGMKYMAPLKWESWWLVHATIAMLIIPVIWAYLVVPDLFGVLATAFSDPAMNEVVFMAMLFGFLWGIGGILFGVSVPYIGLSLTMGIVMGLAGSVGALIPLLLMDDASSTPQFPYVIAGLIVTLSGVAITAKAGINKDKLVKEEVSEKSNIGKGIFIAVACGVLSALLNVGFVSAAPIAELAEKAGALDRNASLAAWVVVLLGAYIMNAGYAIFLLIKNNSWNNFKVAGSAKAYKWAIIASIFWFGALGVYGQGAALIGPIGGVIGWPMLLGLSLIVSNFWAYKAGEWKGAKKPFKLLLVGLVVLIFASILLGYSNSVS
ncbi:rhamnose/proton symporter RhaT [Lutimonas saemankumensis]|uniref:L-rhamnose/proton symporter RhaT n=1 Tax=Lutimonas saemankumensis TaxID=483016 RepID=UPI001CD4748F|nr:L-rhamnose/proton symporter RhaT [Lutimonas saemankumensis]MCA0932500.1 rhamnose/proton symporter RhaT [Lutimonas saemankumensis]